MFYAGGFLYNPISQEILLHKRDGNTLISPNMWAFFGGLSIDKENPIDTFKRELHEELGIILDNNSIKALTNYFNPDIDTHRYVFFAIVYKKNKFQLREGEAYGWFTLKNAFTLNLSK